VSLSPRPRVGVSKQHTRGLPYQLCPTQFQAGGSTTPVSSPWYVWTSSSAIASGHCIIAGVNVSFSVPYNSPVGLSGMAYQPFTCVLDTNHNQSSSIWWGTRLVTNYWRGCLWAIGRTKYVDNKGKTNPSLTWAAATKYSDTAPTGFCKILQDYCPK